MTKEGEKEQNTQGFSCEIDPSEGKTTESLPDILTYDEMDRLLLVIDDLEDLIAIRLMLFAGLRISEACDILVKDVITSSRSVFVRQGKGSKDRYAPLDIGSISLIRSYVTDNDLKPDDKVIKSSVRTIQRHVTDYYDRADIKNGQTCHSLRHSCATWQLDKGISLEVVKENLGHSDISITQIYLHLNIRQRSRTYSDATRFGA